MDQDGNVQPRAQVFQQPTQYDEYKAGRRVARTISGSPVRSS